ncbi:MAG: EAL domain-containing protein [Gammaproteobacteria bacterium]|nr:EAL domain-containing protein [Gammaproteobacteria bacterium]
MPQNTQLKKRDSQPENFKKTFRLSFLLALSIITITVSITLTTAFMMFKLYDERLTDEFREVVISDSLKVSQQINYRLQGIKHQLRLMALDNSIRVTLLLDVSHQLEERLKIHHDKYMGVVHFILKKASEEIISSSKLDSDRQLISDFLKNDNKEGQILRTKDGNIHVVFTTPITRKENRLGTAGSIYRLEPDQILIREDRQHKSYLLYKDSNNGLIDIKTGKSIEILHVKAVSDTRDISMVKLGNNYGYIMALKDYPNLFYFVSSAELEEAKKEGIFLVVIISFLALALSISLAIWLSRKISSPLNYLVSASQHIAHGRSDSGKLPRQSHIAEISDFSQALILIIRNLKKDEEKIRHQASYDALTSLPNRNLFVDRFQLAIEKARRDKSRIALLFIDLDQFKQVNDTLGHSAGDQLLQQAGQRLSGAVRSSDTVARLGGDEFTVLMPEINELHHVETVVNNILEILSAPYINIANTEAFVSSSIGITVFPDDGADVNSLLRNADSAMYRAKDKGRNNAQFFTLEMNQSAIRRRELDTALRKAIENKDLKIHFQPIYDVASGEIYSAEALLRWHSEDFGNISPVEFIPLAEDTGLIVPLGEWLLEKTCSLANNWQGMSKHSVRIAVNVSSRQFQRRNIMQHIEDTLLKTGFPSNLLTIEITESLLLGNDKNILKTLHHMRELGVEIAIDDFGTGYSSLSYLKRFPVSTLKIDRSFISDLPNNPEDEALVEAILSMANSLDLKVVAEGVETIEQLKFLKERNCPYVQGFYFSKPVPNEEFVHLLSGSP